MIVGAIVAGVTIGIDLIEGGIEGADQRSKLQELIPNLVYLRVRLFIAKKKLFILNSALESLVKEIELAQTSKNPLLATTNVDENVRELLAESIKSYKKEWDHITYTGCVIELAELDRNNDAWTNEDPKLV